MDMAENDDELMTPEETAELLRVAVSTLVRWRRETRKRKEQVGPYWVQVSYGTVAYRRSTVREFIDRSEVRAEPRADA